MELTIILVIVPSIGAFVWMGYNGSKKSKTIRPIILIGSIYSLPPAIPLKYLLHMFPRFTERLSANIAHRYQIFCNDHISLLSLNSISKSFLYFRILSL
ncbi:hypothetical protein SAMN05660236_4034 [Ohtaekwangia koreensis]|uniref:Uncharacterized protein n=1 Tax=Ohtaekwangia koreensis TaxID=688867 RepID=A0A1T5M0V7_9BACT|nr:hypothetical protein SAMN05660236_4034 [Ohtaekwangia koreensis]